MYESGRNEFRSHAKISRQGSPVATSYKHTSDMKTNLTKTKLGECSGGQGREDRRSYSGGETVILTLSMIYPKALNYVLSTLTL